MRTAFMLVVVLVASNSPVDALAQVAPFSPLAQKEPQLVPSGLTGSQLLKAVFATLDTDADGKLQEEEASGLLRDKLGSRWPINAKNADEWRALADANGDGDMTWLEALTVNGYVLSHVDEKLYSQLANLPVAKQMLTGAYEDPPNRYCADESDQALNLQYRKPPLWQLMRTTFVELDKNNDQQLNASEIRRRSGLRAVALRIDEDKSESLSQTEVYKYLVDYESEMIRRSGESGGAAITQMYKRMGCSARGHIDPSFAGRVYTQMAYGRAASNDQLTPIFGAPLCVKKKTDPGSLTSLLQTRSAASLTEKNWNDVAERYFEQLKEQDISKFSTKSTSIYLHSFAVVEHQEGYELIRPRMWDLLTVPSGHVYLRGVGQQAALFPIEEGTYRERAREVSLRSKYRQVTSRAKLHYRCGDYQRAKALYNHLDETLECRFVAAAVAARLGDETLAKSYYEQATNKLNEEIDSATQASPLHNQWGYVVNILIWRREAERAMNLTESPLHLIDGEVLLPPATE